MSKGMVKVKEYRLRNRDNGVEFGFNALMSIEPQMLLIEVEKEIPAHMADRHALVRARQEQDMRELRVDEEPVNDQAALIKAIEDRVRADLERKFSTVKFQPEELSRPEPVVKTPDNIPLPPSDDPELHGPPAPKKRARGLNADLE